MSAGELICGRFRVVEVGPVRADRELFTAVDTVTRQLVTVQRGGRELAQEMERLQPLAGRGLVPVQGLWRDGMRVVVVLRRHVPARTLADTNPGSSERALSWVADIASGLSRLHNAGIVHGNVVAGRITVQGDRAWLDPTGPWSAEAVSKDMLAFATLIHDVLQVPRGLRGRRSVRSLLHQMDPAAPERLPRSAGAVRVASERALQRRRPGRLQSVTFAPRRAAVVLLRAQAGAPWSHAAPPVSMRRARRLARRLDAEGHRVAVVRRALGWSDLLLIGLAALLVGLVLPIVGVGIGGLYMARRRALRCTPHVGRDLPAIDAHIAEARNAG